MGKDILLVNQSSAALMVEIVNAFATSGKYDNIVLAVGNEISPLLNLNSLVKIQKIPYYNKKNLKTRALAWVAATIKVLLITLTKYRHYELFLVSNPPTISFITLLCRNKYSTLVYDVYPDGLFTNFIKERSLICRVWTKINIRFYRNAERVFTISDGMAKRISKYCPLEKIEVVSLWSNPNLQVLKLKKEENIFRINNCLIDKFIILYSGNMGMGHDLECLIDVAERLKSNKNITFVFIGDGYLKPILQKKVKQYRLNDTCLFLPFQPREMLPYSLSSPDLAVVSVDRLVGSICIPSKIMDYIKLGNAILCIAEPDSDIRALVERNGIGRCFRSLEINEISDYILEMYNNPEKLSHYKDNSTKISVNYTSELAKKFVEKSNKK